MRLVLTLALSAAPLAAQSPASLTVAPSGRATAEVNVSPPRVQGQPAPAPLKIRIDYGQPHVRGRQILGSLVPYDSVWRTGANSSTTLTTELDLLLGGVDVPKGAYSLYSLPTRSGWLLIVNKNTGQWGTEYDKSHDLARIPLVARTLSESVESLSIVLQPDNQPPVKGVLRLAWSDFELSTAWRLKP